MTATDHPAPADHNGDSDGGGGAQPVTLTIDPAALAANQPHDTTGDEDDEDEGPRPLPPVRAIPALIVGTGTTTTTAALAAGPLLGTAGLGLVAAGTFAAGLGTIASVRRDTSGKTTIRGATGRPGGASGGRQQQNAGTSPRTRRLAGGTGAGPAGGRRGPGRTSGGGEAGSKGSMTRRAADAARSLRTKGHKKKHGHSDGLGPARTPAAKAARNRLTGQHPKTRHDGKKHHGGGHGGKTSRHQGGTGKHSGKHQHGKNSTGTRAALRRAANTLPGRALAATGRGVHKATTRPLGRALKHAAGRKGREVAGRALAATGRGLHKAVRPAGRAGKAAWSSKASHTARAAVRRLARTALRRTVTAPYSKTTAWWSKRRGAAAHTIRTTAAAAWSLTLGALTLGPSLVGGTLAAAMRLRTTRRIFAWPKTVTLTVFARLLTRSRARRDRLRRAHDITFTVNDPGTPADTRTTGGTDPLTALFGGTDTMSALLLAAQNVADAYSRYSPPLMAAVGAEYAGLPHGLRHVAGAVHHLARNSAEKWPINELLIKAVADVHAQLVKAADYADGIYPHFRTVHEEDIKRLEEPRKGFSGEQMWNIVGGQQSDGMGFKRPSVFTQSCESLATVYARHAPESMMAVYREFCALGKALGHVAATVHNLATRSGDDYPVEQSVADMLRDLTGMLQAASSEADKLMPMFRRLHPRDLSRHETPRKGEHRWDV